MLVWGGCGRMSAVVCVCAHVCCGVCMLELNREACMLPVVFLVVCVLCCIQHCQWQHGSRGGRTADGRRTKEEEEGEGSHNHNVQWHTECKEGL